jgi:hypothetical protein
MKRKEWRIWLMQGMIRAARLEAQHPAPEHRLTAIPNIHGSLPRPDH